MTPSFVDVIYCDDVRQELRNKFTLVGCYGPDLIVQKPESPPVVLPRLCAFVRVVTDAERPFKSLVIRAFVADELLGQLEVPVGATEPPAEDTGPSVIVTHAVLNFVPFTVNDPPGILRVEVETDSGTIRGQGLRIKYGQTEPVAVTH